MENTEKFIDDHNIIETDMIAEYGAELIMEYIESVREREKE